MDRGGSIIDAIVKMAHTLGIVVVAEGVETRREENFLESIHCKIAQGYLYGRPVPIGEFERILDTSRVGDKMQVIEQAKEEPSQKLYWELEQLNLLLLYSHVILFEYDPVSDEAVFTAGKIESDLITMEMSQYVQKLKENPLIHPDYREVIQEVLHSQRPGAEDLDFKADCYRTGTFEWYHAKIHRYCHDKKINKVMGILVRESTPPGFFDA